MTIAGYKTHSACKTACLTASPALHINSEKDMKARESYELRVMSNKIQTGAKDMGATHLVLGSNHRCPERDNGASLEVKV